MSELPDNPTRALVARAANEGLRNIPLDTNPASRSLATTLIEGSPGQLRLAFTAPDSSTQGNGVVSGGTLASMLDLSMAMAVLSLLPPGRTCSTISLSVNMMAAAIVGKLIVQTNVERIGRNVGFARAELFDASGGRLLASATSSLAILEERPVQR